MFKTSPLVEWAIFFSNLSQTPENMTKKEPSKGDDKYIETKGDDKYIETKGLFEIAAKIEKMEFSKINFQL